MTKPDRQETPPLHQLREWWRPWREALFVASLIAIVHHHTSWLDQIDGFTFGAIATWHLDRYEADERPAVAWLYALEEDRFKDLEAYRERSPLDRCTLVNDLSAVFADVHAYNERLLAGLKPDSTPDPRSDAATMARADLGRLDVVTIDLDLSPERAADAKSKSCQDRLDRLLRGQALPAAADGSDKRPVDDGRFAQQPHGATGPACGAGADATAADDCAGMRSGPFPLRVVLMEPLDADTNVKTQRWMRTMQSGGVRFGTSWIRENAGLVTRYPCDPASLAGVTMQLAGGSNDCVDTTARDFRRHCDEALDCHAYGVARMSWIDPGKLRPASLRYRPLDGARHFKASSYGSAPPEVRAVFVGVHFGADTYTTPLNTVYGVDVHAASFLSMIEPTSTARIAVAIALDTVLGLTFARLIRLCWRKFFHSHGSDDRTPKTFAPTWLIVLAGGYLAALFLASIGAVTLLRVFHVWLSPLPMALGMAIEGSVSGQLESALERDVMQRRGGHAVGHHRPMDTLLVERMERGEWLQAFVGFVVIGVWSAVVGYALLSH